MNVIPHYRAIIFGKEHIVKGWRGRKLITDQGSYFVRHIYGDWPIQNWRFFEIAAIQSDGNRGWIINGRPYALLDEQKRLTTRLSQIPTDENLRVHKNKICAVGWVDRTGSFTKTTELLDEIVKFWDAAKLSVKDKDDSERSFPELLTKFGESLTDISRSRELLATWSAPIWLTEFRPAGKKNPLTPEQKKLASVTAKLEEETAQLRKAEAAASCNLKEALSAWMRFDPPGMSADTKARIEKAVKLYMTDPHMRSLAKIAREFKVSRPAVSKWFAMFSKETGFSVVTHQRHETVRKHVQADSEQEEEE